MNVRTTALGKVHAQDANGGLRCMGGRGQYDQFFISD